MQLALNSLSALRAWRAIRTGAASFDSFPRGELLAPSPAPAQRWTSRAIHLECLGYAEPLSEKNPLRVAVPSAASRIRTRGIVSTTYSQLPDGAFVNLGDGVQIASPELVFVEAAAHMHPAVLALLGMELCGRYSRSPLDPRGGRVAFGLEALTTPQRLAEFLEQTRYVRSASKAAEMLPYVLGNAWSPMEASLALLLNLGTDRYGYGLGPIELNARVDAGDGTRVPDILFVGTHVGLNYDGGDHYDEAGSSRTRSLADKRRDRDLASAGYTVLPVTIEDLREEGGLDHVVALVLDLLERETGEGHEVTRKTLNRVSDAHVRQRLIWSTLPGNLGKHMLETSGGILGAAGEFVEEVEF